MVGWRESEKRSIQPPIPKVKIRQVGFLISWMFLGVTVLAQVRLVLSHQGRVASNGVPFSGTGQFKFALVNGTGSETYWRNSPDLAPADGQPDASVDLPVSKGLFSVGLGDTNRMLGLDASMLDHPVVRLRVWFNDGSQDRKSVV